MRLCPRSVFRGPFFLVPQRLGEEIEIHLQTKILATSETENLFQSIREGGLGYQHFSSIWFKIKFSLEQISEPGGQSKAYLLVNIAALITPPCMYLHHKVFGLDSGSF